MKRALLWLFVIVAFILRIVNINQSLWLDEAIGALVVRERGIVSILTQFPLGDNHPPLYYALLKIWSSVFGYSEAGLRSLSVMAGITSVIFIYKIATALSKNIYFSLITTGFLVFSPLHIYYSQEARMYPISAMFATVCIYFFLRLFKEKYVFADVIGFSLGILGVSFSDYMSAFLLAAIWVYAILSKRGKRFWIGFLISHIPLLVLWVFWFPIFVQQGIYGQKLLIELPNWRKVAGGANLLQVSYIWTKFSIGRISFNNKLLQGVITVIGSIPFAALFVFALRRIKQNVFIWLWFMLPLILGFAVSLSIPAFIYFRFLFVLPAFYLILTTGIFEIKKPLYRFVLLSSCFLVFSVSNVIYWLDANQQREQWRQAATFVEANIDAAKEVVVFDNPEPFAPYRWYSHILDVSYGASDGLQARAGSSQKTKDLLTSKSGIWYFEYLHDIIDPNNFIQRSIQDSGFEIAGVYNFYGVGQIYHYSSSIPGEK